MPKNQATPKFTQDLSRFDHHNISGPFKTIHAALKEAQDQGVNFILAEDFATLDTALALPFRHLAYDSTPVLLDNGQRAMYAINEKHAAALGDALSRRDLFIFQLFMSTWMDDAISEFLTALKRGNSKITRLSIHHITGDEFTLAEAACVAEWIQHCQVRALTLQCHEFAEGSIAKLTNELRRLKNKSLKELTVVPHDDERDTRTIEATELVDFVKENRNGDLLAAEDFELLMDRIQGSLKNREFYDAEALSSSLLEAYQLTPEQAGWLVDYRHRALFYIGTEESHRKAIDLLINPDVASEPSIRNRLWMVSTAVEMAYQLGEKEIAGKLIERYLSENLNTPDETERKQNEVRCRLNAVALGLDLNSDHRKKAIEQLRQHPDWLQEIAVPKDIAKEVEPRK